MSITVESKTSATVRKETITWADKMALSSPIDVISSATWTSDHGLTVDSKTATADTTTATISGGQVGKYCTLTCTVVTTAPYTYTESLVIEIVPT
jgi:hypothetical protein